VPTTSTPPTTTGPTTTDTSTVDTGTPVVTTGTVSAGELFFDATGTVDGVPTTFTCREADAANGGFYATQTTYGTGTYYLGGVCNVSDSSRALSFNLSVLASGTASSSACAGGFGVQVLELFTANGYNCLLNGSDLFEVVVDEFVVEPDGAVVWGGTFTTRGAGSMQVDLTGAYRFRSAP
jgi:hypothetical protein